MHANQTHSASIPTSPPPAPRSIHCQPELRTSRKSHNFPIKRKWAIYLPWNQWESPIKISSFCCTVALAIGRAGQRGECGGHSGQDPRSPAWAWVSGRVGEWGAQSPCSCAWFFCFGCRKCNAKCLPPLQLFIMPRAWWRGERFSEGEKWLSRREQWCGWCRLQQQHQQLHRLRMCLWMRLGLSHLTPEVARGRCIPWHMDGGKRVTTPATLSLVVASSGERELEFCGSDVGLFSFSRSFSVACFLLFVYVCNFKRKIAENSTQGYHKMAGNKSLKKIIAYFKEPKSEVYELILFLFYFSPDLFF